MILTEKETNAIEDLKTQEQACIEKYTKYSNQAKDPVLKELFEEIARDEQKHFDSLDQVIKGKVPSVDCNDSKGKNYNPAATYDSLGNSEDKKADCYLATDCIGTEKLVSGEYNSDVFVFGNSDIRKLLADIQIEEQNHAEMLWKYKTANGMAQIKYKTIEFSTKCKTGLPEYRQSCYLQSTGGIGLVACWNVRFDGTGKL